MCRSGSAPHPGATGSPKDRAQFSLGYSRGPLDVTATANYTSDFSTTDPSLGVTTCEATGSDVGGRLYFDGIEQPEYYRHVASFTTTNLNVVYKLSPNLSLKGSILNVFDRNRRSTSPPMATPATRRPTTPRCTRRARWAASIAWA